MLVIIIIIISSVLDASLFGGNGHKEMPLYVIYRLKRIKSDVNSALAVRA